MTAQKIAELRQGLSDYLYFSKPPKNPNVYHKILAYSDVDLKRPKAILSPNQVIKIKKTLLNHQAVPVFQLADGTYIEASRLLIYDDQVIERTSLSQEMWTGSKVETLVSPYVSGTVASKQQVSTYTRVTVTEKAKTRTGVYYKTSSGWIAESQLFKTDTRMAKVQAVLDQKYNKSNYSIYVKQLTTGETAGIHQDQKMYSASVTKLPILYYTQALINQGKLSLTTQYDYVPEVNTFKGAYDPSGSGYLSKTADGAKYSVETLMKDVAKNSDNVASNMLAYYVTGQFDTTFQEAITSAIGRRWDFDTREVSSETAGLMMEAVYRQNGAIIGYLSQTDFDGSRISKNIDQPVAHKIGDAYDFKHDVAIVYAQSPFILSIFTDKASYDDITAIADDVYHILK